MRLNPSCRWFLAFTAAFAVLAGFVFWGTWSLDFVPVMPDDSINRPLSYGDVLSDWLRGFLTHGKFHPGDLLWSGLLISPYFCQELKYAASLYFAALGIAYFLRGRGLSPVASYGAGLLLGFCGYWASLFSAGHGGWFVWMTYGIWPFGLIDRAVANNRLRHWLLLGATLAWGCLWQADLWLIFTVFTGVYFVWRCVQVRTFPWKGMLVAGIALFAVGGAGFRHALVNDLSGRDSQIAEGQTISHEDKASVDEREKRWIFVTNWSLPPAETAEFFIPRLNGDTSCPFTLSLGSRYGTGVTQYTGALGRPKDAPTGNYRQHSLYVGFVTCLLALLGVVFGLASKDGKSARSDLVFFLVAAILFGLFSLGRYCEPVYRIVFSLPFGDYLRAPVKWHHLTEFCLCVLAGFGIEALFSLLSRVSSLKPLALPIVCAVVLIGAIDLARVNHLYCAPVDLREAKRQNCNLQMTFLRKADFNNPQVAAMVRAKKIVSLAQPNPETYLVGVLDPRKKNTDPMPPMSIPAYLGILSVFASFAIGTYALRKS